MFYNEGRVGPSSASTSEVIFNEKRVYTVCIFGTCAESFKVFGL